MPKHRAGGCYSGRHTTIIERAAGPLDAVAGMPEVTKIVLSIIVNKKVQPRIKFKEIPAGLEVTINGNSSFQVIYVYVDSASRAHVQALMTKAF